MTTWLVGPIGGVRRFGGRQAATTHQGERSMPVVHFCLHRDGEPEFGADAARATRPLPYATATISEDGTRYRCPRCGGRKWDANGDECHWCEVTGWLDMPVGYECSPSPRELVAFVAERGRPAADGDRVIAFEGTVTTDRDGPRLLYYGIPTHVVESLTWERFIARHLADRLEPDPPPGR
ncbi:hypothetical protein [Streptomyces sp. NPDC096339]|uniref:hypothetical protein n=1 Tax=Streptomyces sp. NPDC096339 TaxID=3366086 RepID=UPI003815E999